MTMMTRDLYASPYGPGMPVAPPMAHNMMMYGAYLATPTPGLTLPPQQIMYDPSDPTTATEQHYVGDDYFTPVATRQLPLQGAPWAGPTYYMPS